MTKPDQITAPDLGPQELRLDVEHPGIYPFVNLNGFILTSHRLPKEHETVVIGYRVPFLPEIWVGVGYMRDAGFWLGSRGLDPHYQRLNADQVVIWRPLDLPFCFRDGRPDTSSYLQYQYVVGEAPWPTEERERARRLALATADSRT